MRFIFAFIFIFINSGISYSDISTLRAYPSCLTVDFTVPVVVEEIDEAQEDTKRKKKKDELKNSEEQLETELQTFNKLIRIVNSVPMISNRMAVVFFNEDNQIIEQIVITNSIRPTPKYISFMERSSYPRFQGKLDIYQIPEEAFSFRIAVIDPDDNIVTQVKHYLFNKNDSILVSNYHKITSKKPLLLQFEVTGKEDDLKVLVGLFNIL